MRTKYRKGKCINSRAELLAKLDAGEWVYLYDSPKHPKFLINLPVRKMDALITVGAFFEAIEKNGNRTVGNMHYSPKPHTPHWLLDRDNFGKCMFPGCKETKQYPSLAEVEDKISKLRHRNYKNKF